MGESTVDEASEGPRIPEAMAPEEPERMEGELADAFKELTGE